MHVGLLRNINLTVQKRWCILVDVLDPPRALPVIKGNKQNNSRKTIEKEKVYIILLFSTSLAVVTKEDLIATLVAVGIACLNILHAKIVLREASLFLSKYLQDRFL